MRMELPIFFAKEITVKDTLFTLDEDASRYCIQVLRKKRGDSVLLTDGGGHRFQATIADPDRRKCVVQINERQQLPANTTRLKVAISFTKNSSRIEWFLEKAMEIGIQEIIPLVCERTEKEKFKAARFENILVAAMLQSQQWYLPRLHLPMAFEQLVQAEKTAQKFIAHCLPGQKQFLGNVLQKGRDAIVLIGPEGDFTPAEVATALQHHFVPVSLGAHRLRTETAGIVACVWMNGIAGQ